jgi:hypothetical protein
MRVDRMGSGGTGARKNGKVAIMTRMPVGSEQYSAKVRFPRTIVDDTLDMSNNIRTEPCCAE